MLLKFTSITQFFITNLKWTCYCLGTHLGGSLALRMAHHGLCSRGPLICIIPLGLRPKFVCYLWSLSTAIDDVAPFHYLRRSMNDEMDLISAHTVHPLAVDEGEQPGAFIQEGTTQGV